MSNDPVVDPEVKEELQNTEAEDFILEYGTQGGKQEEKERIAKQWLPKQDEWQGKTRIEHHQARALALMRVLPKLFDEISDLEGFLLGAVENYEKYMTSVDGMAREQQTDVLMSMFGPVNDDSREARSAILTAIAGEHMEENE